MRRFIAPDIDFGVCFPCEQNLSLTASSHCRQLIGIELASRLRSKQEFEMHLIAQVELYILVAVTISTGRNASSLLEIQVCQCEMNECSMFFLREVPTHFTGMITVGHAAMVQHLTYNHLNSLDLVNPCSRCSVLIFEHPLKRSHISL